MNCTKTITLPQRGAWALYPCDTAVVRALTNLDGLPIPGSDDIPWFVGLAAGHIFTKRGQAYWKDIGKNMRHAGSRNAILWNRRLPESP